MAHFGGYQQGHQFHGGQFASSNPAPRFDSRAPLFPKGPPHLLFKKNTFNNLADLRCEYEDDKGLPNELSTDNCEVCAVVYDDDFMGLQLLLKSGEATLIPVTAGRCRDRRAYWTQQLSRVLDLDRPDDEIEYLVRGIQRINSELRNQPNHVLRLLRAQRAEKKRRQKQRAREKLRRMESEDEGNVSSEQDQGHRPEFGRRQRQAGDGQRAGQRGGYLRRQNRHQAANDDDDDDLDGYGQTDEVYQRRPDDDAMNGGMFQSPMPGRDRERDRRFREENFENVKGLKVKRVEGDKTFEGEIIEAWKDELSRTRFKVKFVDEMVVEVGVDEVKGLLLNVHNRQTVNEKIAVFETMAMNIATPLPFRRRRVGRGDGVHSD